MIALRLIPVAMMLLIMAAHFFRSGNLFLVLVSFALIVLLFVRRPWALRSVQAGLFLGALEWLRTLVLLVADRRAEGLPFLRLSFILGAVALVTGLCALSLRRRRSREYFRMSARAS